MSNIENLKARAEGIQGEQAPAANTADRVGGLLVDMISEMQTIEGGLTTIENKYTTIINGGGDKVTVTPLPISGSTTPIAQITVGDETKTINAPSAASSTSGVNSVEWSQLYNPADASKKELIGHLIVNNGSGVPVYAPKGGSGSSSGDDDTTPDEDTQQQINNLNNAIEAANQQAEEEKIRLDELLKKLDTEITADVEQMGITAEWIREHFEPNVAFHYDGWDEDLEAFTRRVGKWKESEDGDIETFWSDFIQSWKSIGGEVNAVFNGEDGISEYLKGYIRTAIDNGTITVDLGAEYAKTDDLGAIIKWLFSGLKTSTDSNLSYNDMVSAAKSGDHTLISDVHTYVNMLKDTAGVDISSKIDKIIAGLWNKVNGGTGTAEAGIFAKAKDNSDAIATIVAKATEDTSTATVATKLENWEGGFITTSNLNGAIVSMIANDTSENGPVAAITAKVKDGIGTIKFEADEIHSVSHDYTIQMEKLAIGNDVNGGADVDSKVLMQTFTDENKNPLGFEFVVGSFIDDGHGGITADKNKKTNRVRMNRYYSYLRKIYTTWIQIGEDQYTTDSQRIDISSTATLRWFHHIGSAQASYTAEDGYEFEVGDQVGYGDKNNTFIDRPAGQIRFGADGTLYITGSVSINGDLNVTGNTTHHND